MNQYTLDQATDTVINLADHMNRLRNDAIVFQETFATGDRGYFSPTEDEQVTHLWVSYHHARNALLELINQIRADVGEPSEETIAEFLVAYAATVALVDAARTLRDLFGDDPIVRRKLNEQYNRFGIPEFSFDAVQLSLTDPANARGIKSANEFYDDHLDSVHRLADSDERFEAVLGVIDHIGQQSRVGHRRYIKARAKERTRQTIDSIVYARFAKAIYRIQEWGSCIIGGITMVQTHVPLLPSPIRDRLREIIQPGDVFVTRKEHAATNYFLPGYWPHAAFYIGGNDVIEALKDGVKHRDLGSPFSNDAVALIRPKLDEAGVSEAIQRAKSHLGKPYDFDFDFTRGGRMVCTEVVYRSLEGLGGIEFKLARRAGRETLAAEDLLRMAIEGKHFKQVTVYCPDKSTELQSGDAMTSILKETMGPAS